MERGSDPEATPASEPTPVGRRVAVLIVNWNGGDLTAEALKTLESSTLRESALVVVDNGSCDGSLAEIRTLRPDSHFIENESNLGYAAACNQGFSKIETLDVDFVFLLNNDARLDAEALERLVDAAERHPEAGLFAGKIVYPDGRIWCAGVEIGFFPNLQNLRGFGALDRGQFDREEAVDALTGCGLLIRREILSELKGFDERFFVYVEDVDLCARAKVAGSSCLYVPTARMEHLAGASTGGGYGAWRKRILAYNVAQYLKKHGGPALWLGYLIFELLSWPFVLVVGVLRGRGRAAWAKGQGMFAGLFGLKGPGPPR